MYQPGDSLNLSSGSGDVTLYALWKYAATQSGGVTRLTTSYAAATITYVVPDGVTQISLSMLGGEGGRGGSDASGRPVQGGYQGHVQGSISVFPGEVLTFAVGGGGHDSPVASSCVPGVDGPGDSRLAIGGVNPLGGYAGGRGGSPGYQGCSGYGGSGGAASVIQLGSSLSSRDDIGVIVAGGAGGSGGSGQYVPNIGRISENNFQPSLDSNPTTNGSNGLSVYQLCHDPSASSCDGGAGAGGGGGAIGGDHGDVQFGSGASNEWYGLGAYPGSNATAGQSGLKGDYVYYADNNRSGSISISFFNGLPGAPLNVNSLGAGSTVYTSWLAPVNTGASAISDYFVRYSSDGGSSWTVIDTHSASLIYEIDGMDPNQNYKFEVAAVNGVGQGDYSSIDLPPQAPTITSIDLNDGMIAVNFTNAGLGNNTQTTYQYSLDGGTTWLTSLSGSSPLSVAGLTNGNSYSFVIRAVTNAGASPASNAVAGVPFGKPLYPAVNSVVTQVANGQVDVMWAAANNNGSSITSYVVQAFDTPTYGSQQSQCVTSTNECVLSGLTNGSTYYISIQSINAAGYSLRSNPRVVVTISSDSVSFDPNGGSSTLSSVSYFPGDPAISLPAIGVSNPGYVFGGWALSASSHQSLGSTFVPVGNQTLFAIWTPGSYIVSFDLNGGTGTVGPATYATGGAGLSLPISGPSLLGYTFIGWGTSALTSSLLSNGASINFEVTQDTTLYALWRSAVVDVLRFDTQGGSLVNDVNGYDGTSVDLPNAPSRAGYGFTGWFTAPSGGTALSSPYGMTSSVTLYAQWAANPTDYVAFSTQGGSSVATISGLDGTDVPLPSAPSQSGYFFNGWFTAPIGGVALASPYRLTGTTVLFAQWTSASARFALTYDAGVGSNPPVPVTGVVAGTVITLDDGSGLGLPVSSMFAGWDCGAGVVASVTMTGDVSCTAVYATTPNAPTSVTATTGANAQSVVSWSAPLVDGGSAITGYTVTSTPGGKTCTTTGSLTCTVVLLTNGTSYTFSVTATNARGNSAASAASSAIVPLGETNAIYTLTYDPGLGSNAPPDVTGITFGEVVVLNDGSGLILPVGMAFTGWNCGSGVVVSVTISSNPNCTAQFGALKNLPSTGLRLKIFVILATLLLIAGAACLHVSRRRPCQRR